MDLALQIFDQVLPILNSSLQINHVSLQHRDLVVAMADCFNVLIVLKPQIVKSLPYMTHLLARTLLKLVQLEAHPVTLSVRVSSSFRLLLETCTHLDVLRVF